MRLSTTDSLNPSMPRPETLREALQRDLPEFGAVDWVERTGSTNADLITRSKSIRIAQTTTPPLPWLRGAHLQTAGKGRAGRPWQNQSGACLMFSCAFAPGISLSQLPALAPAVGIATCLALQSVTGNQTLQLKWPNDVQCDGAKLAGLLIETTPSGTPEPLVVIGMGLNMTGASALSTQLERPITDLSQVLNRAAHQHSNIGSWAALLVTQLARAWQDALLVYAANGYAAFAETFAEVDALAGHTVQVLDRGHLLHEGLAQGTDAHGRLRVLTAQGLVPVLVGDVSIRPRFDPEPRRGQP